MARLGLGGSSGELVNANGAEGDDLLRCHLSLNQAALRARLQPVVEEIMQSMRYGERMSYVEEQLGKLWCAVEHRADVKALQSLHSSLERTQQQVQQKADQRHLDDVCTHASRLEESLALKLEHSSHEEVMAALQRVNALIATKADLAALNRTNTQVQKTTTGLSQQEKALRDTAALLAKLDAYQLPQTVQRTKELLSLTGQSLKRVQEAVATKAEQRSVDELLGSLRIAENTLQWKASQQALAELRADTHDLSRQVELKADRLFAEEQRAEAQRLAHALATKADSSQLSAAEAGLRALHQQVAQKVDLHSLNEAKTRLLGLEASVQQKADHSAVREMQSGLTHVRESLAEKVDRFVVADLHQAVGRVQLDVQQKADSSAHGEVRSLLERLREAVEQKADHGALDRRLEDLERRAQPLGAVGTWHPRALSPPCGWCPEAVHGSQLSALCDAGGGSQEHEEGALLLVSAGHDAILAPQAPASPRGPASLLASRPLPRDRVATSPPRPPFGFGVAAGGARGGAAAAGGSHARPKAMGAGGEPTALPTAWPTAVGAVASAAASAATSAGARLSTQAAMRGRRPG